MNHLAILVFISITLTSCKVSSEKKELGASGKLAQKFKPLLQGVWVGSDYLDDVAITKSPARSAEKLAVISELVIDTLRISGDSMDVGMSMGNHEGSEFVLFFKQGQAANQLSTSLKGFERENDFYELGFVMHDGETSLTLYQYSKDKKLLKEIKFLKVPEVAPGDNLEDGFQYIVNKKLISGSYEVTDSASNKISVTLTSDGTIKGLPGFKTFYILTDFTTEPDNSPDQMCFDTRTNNQTCYAFKIVGDTMNLFESPHEGNDSSIQSTKPIYRFIKQH